MTNHPSNTLEGIPLVTVHSRQGLAWEVVNDLSEKQRRFILEATPLSGPSGDYIVMDDSADPLPPDVAHPVTGRLLPLGIAIRTALARGESA